MTCSESAELEIAIDPQLLDGIAPAGEGCTTLLSSANCGQKSRQRRLIGRGDPGSPGRCRHMTSVQRVAPALAAAQPAAIARRDQPAGAVERRIEAVRGLRSSMVELMLATWRCGSSRCSATRPGRRLERTRARWPRWPRGRLIALARHQPEMRPAPARSYVLAIPTSPCRTAMQSVACAAAGKRRQAEPQRETSIPMRSPLFQ